jgi:hypothetical protein
MSPEDTDRWAAQMWEQRKELSDLDADALDALCALWLTQARRIDEDVVGDIDALLAMRGLRPKRNGGGQLGGYRPEQRAAMWRAVLHVQNLWVHLSTMDVYQYLGIRPRRRRQEPTAETVQSRVIAITDRLGHLRPDGFFDVEKFIFRPGKVFAHFLFGSGRQTALLAAQALHYDPLRQTWEKRLARYFSYQWRCKAYAGDLLQPFQVTSLLAAVGVTLNTDASRFLPVLASKRLSIPYSRIPSLLPGSMNAGTKPVPPNEAGGGTGYTPPYLSNRRRAFVSTTNSSPITRHAGCQHHPQPLPLGHACESIVSNYI